jgi:ABC-2 type transport system permease protein
MKGLRIFRKGFIIGLEDHRFFWRSWQVWLLTHATRVSTTAAMWVLMGRLVESQDATEFLLLGQIVIVGSQYTGWTLQAFTWDRMFVGTYPMLIAAPASLVPAMLGRTAIWFLNGVATSVLTLALLVPAFGFSGSFLRAASIVPVVVLVCASSYGFAFWLGTLINWAPRLRNIVHSVVVILMTAICGVVVPVTFWPTWVQGIAAVLPVTHGLQAIRLLFAGQIDGAFARGVALEATIGVGWLLLGVLTLDITVNVARRTGAIEIA